MKKYFALLMVTIVFCACAVQGQERQMFKVSIPFSFTAENATFPAGTVTVYLLSPYNLIRVQSDDRRHFAIIRGIPAQKTAAQTESALVFDRIGGEFFLTQVRESGSDIQRELPLGTRARELTAQNNHDQSVATAITVPVR